MKKKIIFILVPILVVLIGIGAVLLTITLFKSNNANEYTEKITAAEKYLKDGDFENAILRYKDAIKLDSKNAEAYLGLAKLYYDRGELDNAISVLDTGYERTKSDKIKAVLDDYNAEKNNKPSDTSNVPENSETQENSENSRTESTELRINDSLIEVMSSYTYKKYKDAYSIVSEVNEGNGLVKTRFGGIDIDFYFGDTDKVKQIDPSTGVPYETAVPVKIECNGLGTIMSGAENGFSMDDLKNIPGINNTTKEYDPLLKKQLDIFKYKDCTIKIECDENGRVKDDKAWNCIIPDIKADDPTAYDFNGIVRDALNYNPVSGSVTVRARQGSNNYSGDVVAETKTNNGKFVLSLPIGDYTIELIANGYVNDYFDIHVNSNDTEEKSFIISPVVSSGNIRFVLTWGSVPRDLDGHIYGKAKNGMDIHVYFGNPVVGNIADLDVDDIHGYGCETITLRDTEGDYKYFVHRFSSDGSIGTSGAIVKIYTDDGKVKTIAPPANIDPVRWNVFSIKGNKISDINGIVY